MYGRHCEKVFQKCLSFFREEDEAEDLVQEIFVKVFNKLHTFQGKSKFSTWLYSITYNHLVNYAKEDTKKLSERWENLNSKNVPTYDGEESDEYNFNELKASRLEKALDLIEPADKALLLLKYSDDILIVEMIKTFNISESALKMRLKRARMRLINVYNNLD